jgi:serine protease Do
MSRRLMLFVFVLCCSGISPRVDAQQISETYRKVNPSVVILRVQQKTPSSDPQKGSVSLPSSGSGVLISVEGKILTAAHVVQSADRICVEFFDGQLIPARVIATSTAADVALVQLERVPTNAVVSAIGDSNKVDVGDEIFVIGSPYGLSHSLTVGHVSARYAPNSVVSLPGAAELLQTDAAINSGNSGSPMFNLKGEVIGVVTNILSRSGGSEGLGFAVTSKAARQVLLEQKSFWFGLDGILVEGDVAKALNLPQPAGIVVQHVSEDSPAWRQGVRAGTLRTSVDGEDMLLGGDVLLEINGIPVTAAAGTVDQIYASLSQLKAGERLRSKVLRAGQVIELSTIIAAQ